MGTPSYKLALKAGHFFMAHLVLAPPLMFVTKHQGPPLWKLNQSPHPGSLILTTPAPPGGGVRLSQFQSVSFFPHWFCLSFLWAVSLKHENSVLNLSLSDTWVLIYVIDQPSLPLWLIKVFSVSWLKTAKPITNPSQDIRSSFYHVFLFFPPSRGKTSGISPRQVFSGWHKKVVLHRIIHPPLFSGRFSPPENLHLSPGTGHSLGCFILFHQYSLTQVLPEAIFSGPSMCY